MGVIKGKITNKFGEPVEKATVALKDKDFENLYVTYTEEDGSYKLDVEDREYPYLFAVKDYAVDNLEFWCQDINLKNDREINASIDKLEVYGLKVFKIDGAYSKALMVYFRPMSLIKHLQHLKDIFPEVERFDITINGKESKIHVVNQVEEYVGDGKRDKAYLLHVAIPEEGLKESDNYLSVQIVDTDGNLGQAATYFTFNK